MCAPLVGRGVEQVLDQAELAVAADERRLEPLRLQRSPRAGDDANGAPEWRQSLLPLQLVCTRLLEDDGFFGGTASRRTDVDSTGRCDRLDARSGVDEIPGDHPLTLGPDRDGGLAGHHRRTRCELRHAQLLA